MLLVSAIKHSWWLDNLPLSYASAALTAVPLFFKWHPIAHLFMYFICIKPGVMSSLLAALSSLSVTLASICDICVGGFVGLEWCLTCMSHWTSLETQSAVEKPARAESYSSSKAQMVAWSFLTDCPVPNDEGHCIPLC